MFPLNILELVSCNIQKLNLNGIITFDVKLQKDNIDGEGNFDLVNPVKKYCFWYKKVTKGKEEFIIYNVKQVYFCDKCRCSIPSISDTMNMKGKTYCKGCYYDKFDKPKIMDNIRKSK